MGSIGPGPHKDFKPVNATDSRNADLPRQARAPTQIEV